MKIVYIHLSTRMMTKHLISGIKRLELHRRESSVLGKKITSGSMAQVLVVHVPKSIMTEAKSTDAVSLAVQ